MTANLLTFNPSKTEFMLIGLPQQLLKIHSPSLSLPPAQPILPCSFTRNLDFVFGSSLSFSQEISMFSSSCHYHICDLRRIRNSLDHKTAATIATSLVHSRLDYYNSTVSNSYKMHYPEPFLELIFTPQFLQFSTHSTGLKLNNAFNTKLFSLPTTYYTVLHLPTSIVSSIFNPLIPHTPQTVSVWLIINSLLNSNSPIDLFVMLHLLFGRNYPPPFVPSPQKQLMPTQYHSHHLPYLINNLSHQSISKHIFSLSPFLPRLLLSPLPSTFLTSHCPFLAILLNAREYTSISWFCGHYNLLLSIYLSPVHSRLAAANWLSSTSSACIR